MTEMTDHINYAKLIDESMHLVVNKALKIVMKTGLPGEHHFFISFFTNHPGVKISKKLYNKYPEEMTIVLQHQYHDLHVDDEKFSVTLTFSGIPENIVVPYTALTAFADPSVKFGLQFNSQTSPYNGSSAHHHNLITTDKEKIQEIIKEKTYKKKDNKKQELPVTDDNIVDFNEFKNQQNNKS